MLVIAFRNHGGSNGGGINRFLVTPYPSKQRGKDSLAPDPTNAFVSDVNFCDFLNRCYR
jgi:hypothetical protein